MMRFLLAFVLGASILCMPLVSHGQSLSDSVNKQLQEGGKKTGLTKDGKAKDPREIIADVIQIALSLIGMICMMLVVTAGYWYLTSHGESDKIEKAKHTLSSAIIGLAITLAAYGITAFVSKRIFNATRTTPGYDLKENSFPPGGGSKTYDLKAKALEIWGD